MSSYNIVLFLPNQHLQSALADRSHGVVWHRGDEQGEELVRAGLPTNEDVISTTCQHSDHACTSLFRLR